MKEISVKGTLRTELGKKASRELRKANSVPCNLYGEAKDENGKQTFDRHCKAVTNLICKTASDLGVYLEVNANGLANTKKYGFKQ